MCTCDSSYIHVEWCTAEQLLKGDKRFDGKLKRYKAKQAALGPFANVTIHAFLTLHVHVHVH